jgi:hypothetical protein
MISAFAERCSDLPVSVCCRVMKVSTSGYYQRRVEPVTDAELTEAHRANTVFDICKMSRHFGRWETPILRWHRTRLTNAATEGTNLIVKNVKRLGFGFPNFDNYRLRLLLRCGAPWQHHTVASIRPRHPRISA